ncbi:MAG: hypothetical protein E6I55_11220 [Chloroflexi bacterium]|nr:MAG: hypothetical protein E6I55_11220 [Chloroflexota bacterium]
MGPASQPRGQGSRAMMMHALAALVHLIAAVGAGAPVPNPSSDNLSQPVLDHIAGPLLTSAQFLIPSAVAISGIHKMMDHRESGGSFLVDMITKGGGAVLVLQLVKAVAGVG